MPRKPVTSRIPSRMTTKAAAMDADAVRAQVSGLLEGHQAHATFDDAVKGFPAALRGERPHGLPYSAWQLIEHVRIAQRDILDWANNADGSYRVRKWPDEYWPADAAPPDDAAWQKCLSAIVADRDALDTLAKIGDLTAPFPWEPKHNLLRQILLAADHMAYHTAEIVVLRRLLGCWK